MRTQREVAMWVWEQYYGDPYLWAGDDSIDGVDCSGLVIEGLKSAGILPRKGDWRARDLAAKFPDREQGKLCRGDLVFFGDPITHVEIIWSVESMIHRNKVELPIIWTIGASGGNSKTTSREAAAAMNAFVKIRPLPKNSTGRPQTFKNPFGEGVVDVR